MSKAEILRNVSKALNQNPLQNEKGSYCDIIIPQEQDKISEYKRLQEFNKAQLFETNEDKIPQILQEIFQKEGIEQTLTSKSLNDRLDFSISTVVYDKPMEELKDELFSIECAVIEADFGVANLGITAVTSSHNQPRLLSLITKHCVILLKKENILNNLSEVFSAVKKKNPEVLPTNIVFIAGPSRTADIELQVVFGVHGPQKSYVILY